MSLSEDSSLLIYVDASVHLIVSSGVVTIGHKTAIQINVSEEGSTLIKKYVSAVKRINRFFLLWWFLLFIYVISTEVQSIGNSIRLLRCYEPRVGFPLLSFGLLSLHAISLSPSHVRQRHLSKLGLKTSSHELAIGLRIRISTRNSKRFNFTLLL